MQFNVHTLHQTQIPIPVMVFALSHMPIISIFAIDQQGKHDDLAMGKCEKIMKVAYTITCTSALFFVSDCLPATPATYIESARDQGVTILSALSTTPGTPGWLAVAGIVVAVVAMSKSFLGTCSGVTEGTSEVVESSLGLVGVHKSRAFNRAMSILLVSAFTFAVCFINPDAISMIYATSGPLITMILFIMPTLSAWLISALKPYRSVGNIIMLVVGLLYVSVMLFG